MATFVCTNPRWSSNEHSPPTQHFPRDYACQLGNASEPGAAFCLATKTQSRTMHSTSVDTPSIELRSAVSKPSANCVACCLGTASTVTPRPLPQFKFMTTHNAWQANAHLDLDLSRVAITLRTRATSTSASFSAPGHTLGSSAPAAAPPCQIHSSQSTGPSHTDRNAKKTQLPGTVQNRANLLPRAGCGTKKSTRFLNEPSRAQNNTHMRN